MYICHFLFLKHQDSSVKKHHHLSIRIIYIYSNTMNPANPMEEPTFRRQEEPTILPIPAAAAEPEVILDMIILSTNNCPNIEV